MRVRTVHRRRLVALCAWASLAALPAAAAGPSFSDRTAEAGIAFATRPHFDLLRAQMYGGGSVGDFDRDGWPDLFLISGGGDGVPDALYMNNGDGTFTDRAADWGVDLVHRGRGSTVGDFDGDGWPDIYVTSGGPLDGPDRPGRHLLYRNDGNGGFTDVANQAGVAWTSTSYRAATGAAFGDYDLDGDLDLYVCGWEAFDSNRLFRNDGDGTFTDVTLAANLTQHHYAFSPRFVDMNGDRYPELLVASDFATSKYYVNDGDGKFNDRTAEAGAADETNGMGSAVGDFDRDGRPDWYVTSIWSDSTSQDGNHVYLNPAPDTLVPLPAAAGARDGGWGWGAEAVDVDHDGWLDIVETNGWVTPEFQGESSYLYRNNGDQTFTEWQGPASGLEHVGQGRGLLTLDYDRDGDMDLVFLRWNDDVALFRNDLAGPATSWIQVELDTDAAPWLAPDGYGATVTATADGEVWTAWPNGGSTYLGRSEMITHFGLGTATEVDLSVSWADGTTTEAAGVAVDRLVTLTPPIPGTPGEVSAGGAQSVDGDGETSPLRAAWNRTSGRIEVEFEPACGAANHTIHVGDLADVASYGWTGSVCWLGASGRASFDTPGLDGAFFVVVGTTGLVEGSYGRDAAGAERPPADVPGCPLPQDLSGGCAAP